MVNLDVAGKSKAITCSWSIARTGARVFWVQMKFSTLDEEHVSSSFSLMLLRLLHLLSGEMLVSVFPATLTTSACGLPSHGFGKLSGC